MLEYSPSLVTFLFWVAGLTTAAKWGYGSAFLVLVGVVAESIASLTNWIKSDSHRNIIERAGALILILGLAGDLISVGLAQIEAAALNQQAAEAKRVAGEAIERSSANEKEAAGLQQKAASLAKQAEDERRALIELEASVAWRRLSKSEKEKLASKLGIFTGTVAVRYRMFDPESGRFAADIACALRAAKWKVPDPHGVETNSWPPLSTGVTVKAAQDAHSMSAARIFVKELRALGFDASNPTFIPNVKPFFDAVIEHRPLGPQGEAKLRAEANKRKQASSQAAKP
jgi:hypothetical protein